jgi:hypothetical protein
VSPVARALTKAREGDVITFQAPHGVEELEIRGELSGARRRLKPARADKRAVHAGAAVLVSGRARHGCLPHRSQFQPPDYRDHYTLQVLKAALDASSARYGAYELDTSPLGMERDRLMLEMIKGEMVNLSAQITSAEWENKLIPIRIPVDKGLSGYRISLIDSRDQAQFSADDHAGATQTADDGGGTAMEFDGGLPGRRFQGCSGQFNGRPAQHAGGPPFG